MWIEPVFVLCVVYIWKFGYASDGPFPEDSSEEATERALAEGEKRLSEHILEVLEHFKEPDPVGVPGVEIPDPYSVPDIKHSVTFFDVLHLEKSAVHGLSKLKILYVNVNFEDMEVHGSMFIDKLQTKGRYRYSSILMPRQGPYTVNVTGLKVTPRTSLVVGRDGKLKAQDIHIDISFSSISVDFENMGALGGVLQAFINGAGDFIFNSIKPYILKDVYRKAKVEIDKNLEEAAGDLQFPNTITPLDMIFIDARRKVRELELDPYRLGGFNDTKTIWFFTVSLSNTWLTGLSSFHRIGDIIMKLENNTMIANFEIGTQELEGMTQWDVTIYHLITLAGTASFSVEHANFKVVIAQPLDTRKRPELQNLQLEIGNIQARCNGAGALDYLVEFAVNVLPNLLRYQITEALEGPLKGLIQEQLDKIDIEQEIKVALPRIDELVESGIKLSTLRFSQNERYDDDDFFNF